MIVIYLLILICVVQMPPSAARVLFPRLLLKLTEIRSLSEEHSQVLLRVNTNAIQPLMIEVLSLTES